MKQFIDMLDNRIYDLSMFDSIIKNNGSYRTSIVEYVVWAYTDYFRYHWTRSDEKLLSILSAMLSSREFFTDVIKEFWKIGISEHRSMEEFFYFPPDEDSELNRISQAMKKTDDINTVYDKVLDWYTICSIYHE